MPDEVQFVFCTLKKTFSTMYSYGIYDPQAACVVNLTLSSRAHVVILYAKIQDFTPFVTNYDFSIKVLNTETEEELESFYLDDKNLSNLLIKVCEMIQKLQVLYSE